MCLPKFRLVEPVKHLIAGELSNPVRVKEKEKTEIVLLTVLSMNHVNRRKTKGFSSVTKLNTITPALILTANLLNRRSLFKQNFTVQANLIKLLP